MGGIITISKGHDASYPWRQIGTTGRERSGEAAGHGVGEYYLSPTEKGGEPPGIWTGRGGAELGLVPGTEVERAVFEPLYGQHLDPRDPTGETRLGRAPGQFQSANVIYEVLLAAEPEATAERRAELMLEAKARVRAPDLYWDATFSVSKSVSLFHASALANAVAAAEQGDTAVAAGWEKVAQGIWDAVMEGNAAGLDYLQREAGQTRSGYHPGGRWEDAREWVIASFRQHTSRDGDPQLHVHNLILHKVKRESDGAWRALDSMSLYRHRPAASAIAALVAENALTARFGVTWVPRKDGHGREIASVSQELMDMFSSRRQSMDPVTAQLAEAYQAQFGRAPDARALTAIRQWANHLTRRAKEAEPLDMAALVRQWAAQARASEAGALEPLAPAVMNQALSGAPQACDHGPEANRERAEFLGNVQAQVLIEEAVAAVQAGQAAWTRADLIRRLGERLPAQMGAMAPERAATILPELAQRALATRAVMLSAPEWPQVPDCLRRESGESLYVPHGAERYATGEQLALEERMLADARETGAPRLEPRVAARLLGTDQARLEALLGEQAQNAGAGAELAGAGLRADQAAAAYFVLTSARRAEVLAGPAGSGKTTTAAEIARLWRAAGMGPVIGLTTSQSAANLLNEAGITESFNTARFLGHLEGQREALGSPELEPGSLIILDEASMMSIADTAAILALARRYRCKVVVTGDHCQITAVEGGGAMAWLARELGHVQLTEPQRFAADWERQASLGLRTGDVSVLRVYEEHGRLRGGTPDEAAEHAYRGWLADYLDGKDSLLIARTEDQVRELARRAREDLIRYGLVDGSAEIRLSAGQLAGVGDLVVARRNSHAVAAGEPGRDLANRDVLRITRLNCGPTGMRVEVRRLVGREQGVGGGRWSGTFLVPKRYLAEHGSLAYAATQHAAIGRTTDTAHVLVDGLGDRQGLYVALSRGREANYAYCVTDFVRAADVREGSRPDPEMERSRRLTQERDGQVGEADGLGGRPAPGRRLDPVSVLAGVLTRDGSEITATETLRRALEQADSLATLGPIWDDVTRRLQVARFEAALRTLLPGGMAEQALADPACSWLWRTLREAETAGLDGGEVLREAVGVRSMRGAVHPARVLDSRVRRMLEGVQPVVPGSWRTRVPAAGSAEMERFLAELAEAMDERVERLGVHAVATRPLWAVGALGPVPDDAPGREAWARRAGTAGAYRERYAYTDPADPIGPEPGRRTPEARAAWHAALAAVGTADGQDLRRCSDADLWLRRSGYDRETAWAPPYVAEELRLMRVAERDAHVQAVRAEHEAQAGADRQLAERHRVLAMAWRALEGKARREAEVFAVAQQVRQAWHEHAAPVLRDAVAADAELRRRHPRAAIPSLRPQDEAGRLPTDQEGRPGEPAPGRPERDDSARRDALGLTLVAAADAIPEQVMQISERARLVQARLEEVAGTSVAPAGRVSAREADRAWEPGRRRQAVLQPPVAELVPSRRVIGEYQALADRGVGFEMERG